METPTHDYLKGVVEALLFISEKPVMLEQIMEVLENVRSSDFRKLIHELKKEYEEKRRGMVIVEIAGGFQMLSSPYYASAIRSFYKTRVKEKLSRPALETLAIVAYKQPVSRSDIELIRGVNSDGVVMHLLNKGLIKIVGRKDVPGRPYIYGTTKLFLEYFGLKSLSDLPKLEEFPSLFANLPSDLPQGDDEAPTEMVDQESQGGKEESDSSVLEETRQGEDVLSEQIKGPRSETVSEDSEGLEGRGIPRGERLDLKQAMEEVSQEVDSLSADESKRSSRLAEIPVEELKEHEDSTPEGEPPLPE